jgi:hypothetical protein
VAGVAVRELLQVVLVLLLGLPEVADWLDLGDDLAGPEAGGVNVGDGVEGNSLLPWRSFVDGSWIWKKNSRISRYEITAGSKTISTASAWSPWLR